MLVMAMALMTGCGEANLQDLRQFVATTKESSPGKPLDPPPEVEPYRPFTYTAQGLKDPFVLSGFAQQLEEIAFEERPELIDNGIHPDPDRTREELEKYALGSLKMVGTFQKDTNLWALIEAPDGIIHRIQKGNYLGSDHGKIINITEQRIDITEIVPENDSRWIERDAFLSLAD
jgi:type IV pilus assembly protein PilP